jgi:hypothetical protein
MADPERRYDDENGSPLGLALVVLILIALVAAAMYGYSR